MAHLRRYHGNVWRLLRRWSWARLKSLSYLPALRHRFGLDGLPGGVLPEDADMDAFGWQPPPWHATADRRLRFTCLARSQYEMSCKNSDLPEAPCRALQAPLRLCRRQGIPAVLLVPPEGSEFRAFYTQATLAKINACLLSLSNDFQVPLIDARTWVADADFYDSHHLLPKGATTFTVRLEQEWLRPLLNNLSRQSFGSDS
jgi:hypothetical protein